MPLTSKEFTLSLPDNVPVTCRLIHLDLQTFVYVSATGDLSFDSLAMAIPNMLQQGDVCVWHLSTVNCCAMCCLFQFFCNVFLHDNTNVFIYM